MIKDYQTKDIRTYPTKELNKKGLWKFKWKRLMKKLSKVSDTVEKET